MPNSYSMVGSEFDRANPNYDVQNGRRISDLLSARYQGANPARREMVRYLGEGMPVDYEGLATAYAMKFGQKAAVSLINALPNMSNDDLMLVQESVAGAAREADGMRDREMNTYQRNDPNFWEKSRANPRK